MYRVISGRGTGKTHDLILKAKETGATILCSNPKALEYKAHAYGIVGVNFANYGRVFEKGFSDESYLIDELEMFANYITGTRPLVGYTLSDED